MLYLFYVLEFTFFAVFNTVWISFISFAFLSSIVELNIDKQQQIGILEQNICRPQIGTPA